MINFGRGVPSADLIDVAGLAQAAGAASTANADASFGYGSPAGYQPLREWIAARHGVDAGSVLVTPGAMQAVALAVDLLVGGEDDTAGEVLVDRPTYDMVLRALAARPVTVRQLALGREWVEPVAVPGAAAVRRCVYAVPTFRNPDGATMALPERELLLERAALEGSAVIEDDPYQELRFDGPALPPLWRLGGLEQVVHVSSFSKTVCPGLRVGYVIADETRIEGLIAAANRTYITPSMFAQAVVHRYLLDGGLDAPLQRMRTELAARAELLCELLSEQLPQARFERPQGGYFVWLRLPSTLTASTLAAAAQRHGVVVAPGSGFLVDGGGEHCVRLCFAAEPPNRIAEGVRRLAAAAREADTREADTRESGAPGGSQQAAGRPQFGEEAVVADPA